MRYPTQEQARTEFDYVDDAECVIKGNLMRGALRRRVLRRGAKGLVFGTVNRKKPSSRACVGWTPKSGTNNVLFLHRVIWIWHYGDPGKLLVDHRSGDPCDNRIGNLRLTTPMQNQMNRRSSRVGSSCPYIGVTVNGHRFSAFSASEGKPVYLGTFNSAVEAARVRDADAKKKAPGFATLNEDLFPEVALL